MSIFYEDNLLTLRHGDVLAELRAMRPQSVHCVVTSPPYWSLRDYSLPLTIWGGDLECEHAFDALSTAEGYQISEHGRGEETPAEKRLRAGRRVGTKSTLEDGKTTQVEGKLAEIVSRATLPTAFRNSRQYVDHRLDTGQRGGALCAFCGAWRGCLGLEPTPDCLAWARGEPPCAICYVCHIRTIWAALWRVLRDDGTCWLNLGDSYAGSGGSHKEWHKNPGLSKSAERNGTEGTGSRYANKHSSVELKPKDLVGIAWRVALALQSDGWYLRSDIIWEKPNPMPESVTDRPTRSHEYVFLLSKSSKYFFDAAAIREGVSGRNRRSVWTIATAPFSEAHFATYPPALVEPCILAGTSEVGCCSECGAPWACVLGGNGRVNTHLGYSFPWEPTSTPTLGWRPTCKHGDAPPVPCVILDCFSGSGTTGLVAMRLGRRYIGIDLSAEYLAMSVKRIVGEAPLLHQDRRSWWTS